MSEGGGEVSRLIPTLRDGSLGSNTPFDPSDFPSLGGGAGGGLGAPGRPNYGKLAKTQGSRGLDLGGKGGYICSRGGSLVGNEFVKKVLERSIHPNPSEPPLVGPAHG